MPKGLKETSSVVAVSALVGEAGPNTFTQSQVDLNLDPLNNEVFVVLAIDLNLTPPDAVAATDTSTRGSVSTTSRTALGTIADSNVLAESSLNIAAAGYVDGGVGFTRLAGETPTAMLDYIGIIATNDFFIPLIMKSTYDNNELFDIERTLVETIARSMDALNVDGTRKNISEYFNSTLLPEVIEEMSVIQRCNK